MQPAQTRDHELSDQRHHRDEHTDHRQALRHEERNREQDEVPVEKRRAAVGSEPGPLALASHRRLGVGHTEGVSLNQILQVAL